jgi:hypothetical protein
MLGRIFIIMPLSRPHGFLMGRFWVLRPKNKQPGNTAGQPGAGGYDWSQSAAGFKFANQRRPICRILKRPSVLRKCVFDHLTIKLNSNNLKPKKWNIRYTHSKTRHHPPTFSTLAKPIRFPWWAGRDRRQGTLGAAQRNWRKNLIVNRGLLQCAEYK